ncbi:hypothetical protein RIF29_31387 [Crotalaria pallida]|uniref:Uncharacterized protein n=1 Tax=Crotalaria pallida TaxID=3830 RepID=A0AAN9EMF0_CROPI
MDMWRDFELMKEDEVVVVEVLELVDPGPQQNHTWLVGKVHYCSTRSADAKAFKNSNVQILCVKNRYGGEGRGYEPISIPIFR